MAKDSTTFERRQRVLTVLHDQPGIRVTDVAQLFRVSEGTIRNDLNALAKGATVGTRARRRRPDRRSSGF